MKRRPSARAFMAGLASGFGFALLAGGLEIRANHARRRGRVWDVRRRRRLARGVMGFVRQRAELQQCPDDERLVALGDALAGEVSRACRRQHEQFLRGQPYRHGIGRYPIRGAHARLFSLDAERNELG